MICNKCDQDLERCTCEDLEQRFKELQECKFLHIGIEYQCRILAHIEQQKRAKALELATKKG